LYASTAHGAGRLLGRRAALKTLNYEKLMNELKQKNIEVMSKGKRTLIEEAPAVYKDVDKVVDIVEKVGIARRVARLIPMGVVKG